MQAGCVLFEVPQSISWLAILYCSPAAQLIPPEMPWHFPTVNLLQIIFGVGSTNPLV